jgi:uncharacterized membrane protein YbhN (UPF0104 family)
MAIWDLRNVGVAGHRWRLIAYAAALTLFVATTATGIALLPSNQDAIAPLFLGVVVVVLAPLGIACNAAEYAVTARLLDGRPSTLQALRVAVLSTAANLLPVPGSALVRVASLRQTGGSTVRATRAVLAAGVTWTAVTCASVGAVALTSGHPAVGATLLAGAAGLLVVASRLARGRGTDAHGRTMGLLVVVEGASTVVATARLWCCARGLGFDVSVGPAVALASASVLASLVGIAPGGLGLREALAAAIGPLVGIPAALAASVAAVDRVIGSAVVAVVVVGLAAGDRRRVRLQHDAGATAG